MLSFCERNAIEAPRVEVVPRSAPMFGTCAYYRANVITICVERCAAPGELGRQWSWPGYVVDRTPYGVIQHELGHHVDMLRSRRRDRYRGDYSINVRKASGEKPVTSYCPDDGEWFAEIFRLYVTNPDLLRRMRPRVGAILSTCFAPVFADSWRDRLAGAPERTLDAAARKIPTSGS
jgi:hypothetical protein